MSSPAWIKGLKELSKRTVSGTDFDKLWVELTTERNDRGAALIRAHPSRECFATNDSETTGIP